MTINKCWVNDILLTECFKELINDVSNLPVWFVMNIMFISNLPGFIERHLFPEVNAGFLLDQINHVNPLKRLIKVNFISLVSNNSVIRYNLSSCLENSFRFIHNVS